MSDTNDLDKIWRLNEQLDEAVEEKKERSPAVRLRTN